MTNETQTTETTAIEEYAAWEVENFVDDAEAMGIINAFVYKFKQGGRDVTGLTARAIEEICLLNKPRVSISKSKVTDEGDTVFAEATAMAKFVVPSTKETRPDGTVIETEGYEEVVTADGVRREPKFLYSGKPDPHVDQKALTKAMRAARRQLISQAALILAKEELLKKQGGKPVNVPQNAIPPAQPNSTPAGNNGTSKETATDRARKAFFAAYNEQADDLAKCGVSKDEFLSTLKVILGVESSKQITLVQWQQTRADLKAKGYGKIVKDIIAKVNETKSDADTKKENGATDKEASPAPTGADPRF